MARPENPWTPLDDEQQEYVINHEKDALRISKELAPRGHRFHRDECDSIALLALIKASRSYDKEKGAFVNYLAYKIGMEFKSWRRNEARKWNARPEHIGDDLVDVLDHRKRFCPCEYQEELDRVFNAIPDKYHEHFRLYLDGFSYSDIAERFEKTESSVIGVIRVIRKNLAKLYEEAA